MLVTDEQTTLKTTTGEIISKHDPDGPPPYEAQSAEAEASSSTSTIYPPVPADLQANNFLVITRTHDSLKGRYIIDTALEIPASLLPALDAPEEGSGCQRSKSDGKGKDEERLGAGERPNLKLSGQHGSMAADVWIVNSKAEGSEATADAEAKRAFVEVTNAHGSVKLQVAADPTNTPFALLVSTDTGSITLYIPRTYTGALTIRKGYGSVKLSPALESRLQTFSDIKGKRVCFVGDFRQAGFGQGGGAVEGEQEGTGGWRGNAIEVGSVHGSIRVSYVDDETRAEGVMSVLPFTSSGTGFWSKLFTGW